MKIFKKGSAITISVIFLLLLYTGFTRLSQQSPMFAIYVGIIAILLAILMVYLTIKSLKQNNKPL